MAITTLKTDFKIVQTINAPLKHIWHALTNRDDLCDWLCYDADVRVEDGGFGFFRWHEGHYAFARFEQVIEYNTLKFTWEDDTNPTKTTINITLTDEGEDGATLTFEQRGLTDDIQDVQNTWQTRLDELKGMLERGERPSIADRVIIGIYPQTITDEVREEHGITLDHGVLVHNVVPDYSAASAGIQAGDVIIQVNNVKITENAGIFTVTQGKKPGDSVQVTYHRDGENHTVDATLRGYPIPPLPKDYAELATRWDERYKNIIHRLHKLTDDATAEALNAKPDDQTWSVREWVAHLILWERHTLEWLSTYLNGPRRINPYQEEQERINALLTAYDTTANLIELLAKTQQETRAILGQFTPELQERRDYLWWINFESQYNLMAVERALSAIDERLHA